MAKLRKDDQNLQAPPQNAVTEHPLFSGKTSVGMISGQNPKFKPQASGHEQLGQQIAQMGLRAEPRDGRYGAPEKSWMVYGPTREQMFQLGQAFGQESVVFSHNGQHELMYTNGPNAGRYHPALDHEWFNNEPEDFYTHMPELGGYLRLNFDWDMLHPSNLAQPEAIAAQQVRANHGASSPPQQEQTVTKAEIAQELMRTLKKSLGASVRPVAVAPHPHAYPWHNEHTDHHLQHAAPGVVLRHSRTLSKAMPEPHPHTSPAGPNEQAAGVGVSTYAKFAMPYGAIDKATPTDLFHYQYQGKNQDIDRLVKDHGFTTYYAGGKYGKPDLANRNYNTKHLMIYDPSPGSGGDFGTEQYTDGWRKIHELSHALTYPELNNTYGEGRRIGKLGHHRTLREALRAVHWEWLAAHKQRELSQQIGVHVPDHVFHKELNTVMHDAIHRAVTGKFTEPSGEGYRPHEHRVPLETALGMVREAAHGMGISGMHDLIKKSEEPLAKTQRIPIVPRSHPKYREIQDLIRRHDELKGYAQNPRLTDFEKNRIGHNIGALRAAMHYLATGAENMGGQTIAPVPRRSADEGLVGPTPHRIQLDGPKKKDLPSANSRGAVFTPEGKDLRAFKRPDPNKMMKSEKQSFDHVKKSEEHMADEKVYEEREWRLALAKGIQERVDAYSKSLLELRQRELKKSLPVEPAPAMSPVDVCPLCGMPDIPGQCKCLAGPMAPLAKSFMPKGLPAGMPVANAHETNAMYPDRTTGSPGSDPFRPVDNSKHQVPCDDCGQVKPVVALTGYSDCPGFTCPECWHAAGQKSPEQKQFAMKAQLRAKHGPALEAKRVDAALDPQAPTATADGAMLKAEKVEGPDCDICGASGKDGDLDVHTCSKCDKIVCDDHIKYPKNGDPTKRVCTNCASKMKKDEMCKHGPGCVEKNCGSPIMDDPKNKKVAKKELSTKPKEPVKPAAGNGVKIKKLNLKKALPRLGGKDQASKDMTSHAAMAGAAGPKPAAAPAVKLPGAQAQAARASSFGDFMPAGKFTGAGGGLPGAAKPAAPGAAPKPPGATPPAGVAHLNAPPKIPGAAAKPAPGIGAAAPKPAATALPKPAAPKTPAAPTPGAAPSAKTMGQG